MTTDDVKSAIKNYHTQRKQYPTLRELEEVMAAILNISVNEDDLVDILTMLISVGEVKNSCGRYVVI